MRGVIACVVSIWLLAGWLPARAPALPGQSGDPYRVVQMMAVLLGAVGVWKIIAGATHRPGRARAVTGSRVYILAAVLGVLVLLIVVAGASAR